ncbi:hypothetical protein AAFF39_05230 [Lactococcus garvieae]
MSTVSFIGLKMGPASTYLLLSKYDEMMGDSRLQEILASAEITERNEKYWSSLNLSTGDRHGNKFETLL